MGAGLGDVLHAARYLPRLAQMVDRINMLVPPPLERIVARFAPKNVHVYGFEHCRDAVSRADYWLGQANLWSITGEGYGAAAWIKCDDVRREDAAKPRIGVVWSGNVNADYNNLRAVPIERFEPLFAIDGIEWHSLQIGPKAAERPDFMVDHTDEIHDFLDTARVVAALDLVITIDSSVANLCGSMGHPFWVLVNSPGESDWRWALEGETTPWFPSARVFRQGKDRKWKRPMREVTEALLEWRAAFSDPSSAAANCERAEGHCR